MRRVVHNLRFVSDKTLDRRYFQGPLENQLLVQENVTQGATAANRVWWVLPDHLGSTRDLVDTLGKVVAHYQYDSFGVLLDGRENVTRYQYTGREHDSNTDLNYHRARWYDPLTGKWMSEDPIGFAAGDANVTRYVGNRVLTHVDPNGLMDVWFWWYWYRNGKFLDVSLMFPQITAKVKADAITVAAVKEMEAEVIHKALHIAMYESNASRGSIRLQLRRHLDYGGRGAGPAGTVPHGGWDVFGRGSMWGQPDIEGTSLFAIGNTTLKADFYFEFDASESPSRKKPQPGLDRLFPGVYFYDRCVTVTGRALYIIEDAFDDALDIVNKFPGKQEFPGGTGYAFTIRWIGQELLSHGMATVARQ